MTQYQQVLAAAKKIGGKGTTDEIFKAIDGIEEWKTQTKKASVASYLSTSNDFRKEGDVWIYEENKSTSDTVNKNVLDNASERGLYFITLNPGVKPPIPGLVFKIGKSERAGGRLDDYNASLPYKPIQELCFYRIPSDVNLLEAEGQVRSELLGNDTLGFRIERFFGNHQDEWLHTLDLSMSTEDINKLAMVVNRIIKETIDNLRKPNEDN